MAIEKSLKQVALAAMAMRAVSVCCALCLALSSCTPKGPSWTEYLALAQAAAKDQDWDKAEANYAKAAHECEKQFGPFDGRRANCLAYLGELLRDEQQWGKAAEVYKDLLPILEKLEPKSKDFQEKKDEYAEIQSKLKEYGIGPDGVQQDKSADSAKTKDAGHAHKHNKSKKQHA